MLLLITEVLIPLLGPNATLRCIREARLREMEAKWKHLLAEFDPAIPAKFLVLLLECNSDIEVVIYIRK